MAASIGRLCHQLFFTVAYNYFDSGMLIADSAFWVSHVRCRFGISLRFFYLYGKGAARGRQHAHWGSDFFAGIPSTLCWSHLKIQSQFFLSTTYRQAVKQGSVIILEYYLFVPLVSLHFNTLQGSIPSYEGPTEISM